MESSSQKIITIIADLTVSNNFHNNFSYKLQIYKTTKPINKIFYNQ